MPRLPTLDNGYEPISGYKLIDFLGRGQFGEVWKAVDASGKRVAIKIIDLQQNTAALKELRAFKLLRNMDHPHLVAIYTARLKDKQGREVDFENAERAKDKGQLKELVIAMGLADKSLSARLKELNPDGTLPEGRAGIPIRELIPYMEGAAKGIDFLNSPDHRLGTDDGPIIHCDIKPDNMLIQNGEVQIADCGVAIMVNNDLRRKTQAAGTMAYNPPELMGNKPGPGTDQYSLAISYFELRTGRFPFPEDVTQWELMTIHAQGRLELSHPILTEAEGKALRRATAIQTRDRFDSCQKFVRALKRAVIDQLDDMEVVPPQTQGSLGGSGGSMNTGSGRSMVLDLTPQQIDLPPAPPPVRATTPPPGLTATLRPAGGGLLATNLVQTLMPPLPAGDDSILATRHVPDEVHQQLQDELRRGASETAVPPVTATPRGADPARGRSSIEFEIDDDGSELMLKPPEFPPPASSVPELPDLGMIVPRPRGPLLPKEATPPPRSEAKIDTGPVPMGTVLYPQAEPAAGTQPESRAQEPTAEEPPVSVRPDPERLFDDNGPVVVRRKSNVPLLVATVGVLGVAGVAGYVLTRGLRDEVTEATKPADPPPVTTPLPPPPTSARMGPPAPTKIDPPPPTSPYAKGGELRKFLDKWLADDSRFPVVEAMLPTMSEAAKSDAEARALYETLARGKVLRAAVIDLESKPDRGQLLAKLRELAQIDGFKAMADEREKRLFENWSAGLANEFRGQPAGSGRPLPVADLLADYDTFVNSLPAARRDDARREMQRVFNERWNKRVSDAKTPADVDAVAAELKPISDRFEEGRDVRLTAAKNRKETIQNLLGKEEQQRQEDAVKAVFAPPSAADQAVQFVGRLQDPGPMNVPAFAARVFDKKEQARSPDPKQFRRRTTALLAKEKPAGLTAALLEPLREAVAEDIKAEFTDRVAAKLIARGQSAAATDADAGRTLTEIEGHLDAGRTLTEIEGHLDAARTVFGSAWSDADAVPNDERKWAKVVLTESAALATLEVALRGDKPAPFAAALVREWYPKLTAWTPESAEPLRQVVRKLDGWQGRHGVSKELAADMRAEYARACDAGVAKLLTADVGAKHKKVLEAEKEYSKWARLGLAEAELIENPAATDLPQAVRAETATAGDLGGYASYLVAVATARVAKRADAVGGWKAAATAILSVPKDSPVVMGVSARKGVAVGILVDSALAGKPSLDVSPGLRPGVVCDEAACDGLVRASELTDDLSADAVHARAGVAALRHTRVADAKAALGRIKDTSLKASTGLSPAERFAVGLAVIDHLDRSAARAVYGTTAEALVDAADQRHTELMAKYRDTPYSPAHLDEIYTLHDAVMKPLSDWRASAGAERDESSRALAAASARYAERLVGTAKMRDKYRAELADIRAAVAEAAQSMAATADTRAANALLLCRQAIFASDPTPLDEAKKPTPDAKRVWRTILDDCRLALNERPDHPTANRALGLALYAMECRRKEWLKVHTDVLDAAAGTPLAEFIPSDQVQRSRLAVERLDAVIAARPTDFNANLHAMKAEYTFVAWANKSLSGVPAADLKPRFGEVVAAADAGLKRSPVETEEADLRRFRAFALEDIAWMTATTGDAYVDAIAAFQEAVPPAYPADRWKKVLPSVRSDIRVGYGRTLYRAAVYPRTSPRALLAEATRLLIETRDATAQADKLERPLYLESCYWLAMSQWAAGEYDAATSSFQTVAEAPPDVPTRYIYQANYDLGRMRIEQAGRDATKKDALADSLVAPLKRLRDMEGDTLARTLEAFAKIERGDKAQAATELEDVLKLLASQQAKSNADPFCTPAYSQIHIRLIRLWREKLGTQAEPAKRAAEFLAAVTRHPWVLTRAEYEQAAAAVDDLGKP